MKRFDESGHPPADAGRIELRNRTSVEFGRIAADGSIPITINTQADVRAIDPRIYGVNFGGTAAAGYGSYFDRQGGNAQSRYNWQLNSDNRGKDWYYESIADSNSTAGFRATSHVQAARAIGAQSMLTMPMIGWTSKLGTNRAKKWSFSVAKYGAQQAVDPWNKDAGNGIKTNGSWITNNDPNDANQPVTESFYTPWIQQLVNSVGGPEWWILDNEPSLWHVNHRDVVPTGPRATDMVERMRKAALNIRNNNPSAKIAGGEEWGWNGYLYSPYDNWYGAKYGWNNLPDRQAAGGEDFSPWLLRQLAQIHQNTGVRMLDAFTVHYYPQGGEFDPPTGRQKHLRRNRSTRSLWDPNYTDETWINSKICLIPRIKQWVQSNYPGLEIGITEYSWGSDGHVSCATAQADVLGIFGREGLSFANRWTAPSSTSPVNKVFRLYRNAAGNNKGFGNQSVRCQVPNPDDLSAFAAIDTTDGALTVMIVAKAVTGQRTVRLNISGFRPRGLAIGWQLGDNNRITPLGWRRDPLRLKVPAPSVTLWRIPSA